MGQSRDEVQQLFRSGVDAVGSVTASFEPTDWDQPACGTWTARETATHLVGVVDWYHDWLDRAVAGDTGRPFPEAEAEAEAEAAQEPRLTPDRTAANPTTPRSGSERGTGCALPTDHRRRVSRCKCFRTRSSSRVRCTTVPACSSGGNNFPSWSLSAH